MYKTEEERKAAHKEARRRYYIKNKEKILEYQSKWNENNPNYHSEYNKKYYQDNKDKYKQYHKTENKKRYYQEHKEEMKNRYRLYQETPFGRAVNLVCAHRQEDKKYNRGECTITAQWIVDNIFTKTCVYCGESDWHKLGCNRKDNTLPHTPDNVEPCCCKCNKKLPRKT